MHLYTHGIIRILMPLSVHYGHLSKLYAMAEAAGYEACAHNGRVHVKTPDGWHESPFYVADFCTASE